MEISFTVFIYYSMLLLFSNFCVNTLCFISVFMLGISSPNVTFFSFLHYKYDFYLSHCGSSLFTCLFSLRDCQTHSQPTSSSSITSSYFSSSLSNTIFPQDAPSSYTEHRYLPLCLHNCLYLYLDGNFDLFQYLLVSHPVISDQSPH